MKKAIIIAGAIVFAIALVGCDTALHNAEDAQLTFKFVNFDAAEGVDANLAGGFDAGEWGNWAHTFTFTDGGTEVTLAQRNLESVLFRFATDGWADPDGIDYDVLEPNAWNSVDDGHSYDSGDPNWGIGNAGEAKPEGGFMPGGQYEIVIDALDGDSRAKMTIDGEVVWE
ncbi:hypothetical protein [Spirochaeta africana]|uniref:Uncharacterized protein n=1 Tax=Spirochaeta africana (strain ATCC 700263 / DSM 8902 / Z-7692) TaxID=889378 RepID=H9ULJ8_SPIAZ|nr:hypothetical protein [Spirochaeta africana]AFG38391.1 hypothetical protein Spiaf_2359 [Spirochaeta africana DSM 8902]